MELESLPSAVASPPGSAKSPRWQQPQQQNDAAAAAAAADPQGGGSGDNPAAVLKPSTSQTSVGSHASSQGSIVVGLPVARFCFAMEVVPPADARGGVLLRVVVPGCGGQNLLVRVPHGWQRGQPLHVPYEISATGVVQHPLAPPEGGGGGGDWGAPVPAVSAEVQKVKGQRPFCGGWCCAQVTLVFGASIALSVGPSLLGEKAENPVLKIVGLVLSGLLPTAVLMSYCYCSFRRSLLKKQMAITFCEAILWLVPLMGVFLLLRFTTGFFSWCECEEVCPAGSEAGSDDCERVCDQGANCYAHDAFTAFILASLLEECLKYLAIRRITFASLVVDAQSLFIYSACGALGFATVENVLYVLSGGMKVAILRAVLSVPLHMSTGLLIGCSLGFRRFLSTPVRCPLVLVTPVLVHGFYDIFLFWGSRLGGPWGAIGLLLGCATCILGWVRVRAQILQLEAVVPQTDVRPLIWQGTVRPPTVLCLPCCWAKPEEGVERRLADDGKAYTYQEFLTYFGDEDGARAWRQAGPAPLPTRPVPVAMLGRPQGAVTGRHE